MLTIMATLRISDDLKNVIKKVVLDTYFPIGSLYLTVGNENPNTTIGGTWSKISGYYLYADTSINNTGYTGKGTQGHAITVEQMPSHSHNFWYFDSNPILYPSNQGGGKVFDWDNRWLNSTGRIQDTGGNQPHSHNIATKGIYVWQRTK